MDTTRRNVLKAIGSLVITGLVLRSPSATAATRKSYKAMVLWHAGGGWDTAHCPGSARLKGGEDPAAIRVAVYGDAAANQDLIKKVGLFTCRADQPTVEQFVKDYKNELVACIVQMPSNDHGAGTRISATGVLDETAPTIGALFAASSPSRTPLPFIVAGGSTNTGSLVPVANLGSVRELRQVITPNQYSDDGAYFSPGVASLKQQFQLEQNQKLLAAAHLPSRVQALKQIIEVGASKADLTSISDSLTNEYPEGLDPVVEMLLDLIEREMVQSISLAEGGFDTHSSDGQRNLPQTMANYFGKVSTFWKRAKARGLSHKPLMVLTSEFSRTPSLNEGGGTDHWPGTNTVMLLGENVRSGVIGENSDDWFAKPVNPKTLKVDDAGVVPTIGHFQSALRIILGISPELTSRFPIQDTGIDAQAFANALTR